MTPFGAPFDSAVIYGFLLMIIALWLSTKQQEKER